jgi:L-ascorbate metabolism protein UlaG (beta-lactamase superfamily)
VRAVRRCGSSGSSAHSSAPSTPTFHLVALGDSIPFGQHFCGDCATFVDLYGAELRAGKPTLILVTNDYDDIVGDPVVPAWADPIVVRVVTDFARATCRTAEQHQAMCIDTYHAFNGPAGKDAATRLLEADHTHPNEAGHELITHLLARVPTEQVVQG